MARPIKCPGCGRRIDSSYPYCPFCAYPVNRPDSDDTPDQEPRRRSGGCAQVVAGFFIVLLAGALGLGAYYYFAYASKPEPVVVTDQLRSTAAAYKVLGEFYHGIAQGHRGDQTYYFDTHGNLVDPPSDPAKMTHHTPDDNRLQRIERGGLWGAIDRDTRDTIIKPIYSTLGNFYDGLALATLKFGDQSMPEYCCFYGYVDTRGGHTFTADQFEQVRQAGAQASRREYIASLPKGITLTSLGLPPGLKKVVITQDSLGRVELQFDRRGVLTHCDADMPGMRKVSIGVADGFITSMTNSGDSIIRHYRYLREPSGPNSENIVRQGSDGRRQVGSIQYSGDDGTVTFFTIEWLPQLSTPGVSYTSVRW